MNTPRNMLSISRAPFTHSPQQEGFALSPKYRASERHYQKSSHGGSERMHHGEEAKERTPSTRRHARQHLCPEVLVSPQRTPERGRLRRTFSHNIAAKSTAHGQGASFGARFSHSAGYMLRQSRKTLVRALYIRSRASSLQQ